MSLFILDDMIIDEAGGDSQENKRVKITTACDTCRRRKVKCDGESPCANCQRGSYQCTFSDATAKRPRGPPKGFVALIEDRLHTIESLLVNLVNKDNVNDLSTLTKDVKQYSDVSQKHPGYADEITNEDDEILQNNLIHPNVSNTLQSNTLSFLTLDDQNSNDGLSEYPLPKSTFNLKPIPEEISKQLFEKYFNNFHPYFPIINRGHFSRLLNNVNVENQPSKLLIEAICAVGAMFPPMVKQNTEYNSQFFYERAKNLLDHFTDVPRLSTIQALLLLCMLDQGKPSSYRSQTYSSIAIRMAQSIGLNRKNGAAYQGAKDRQTKKLVWWGCFVLDRINSLNTGDPLIINDKLCDIEFPSPDEMDEMDEDNNEYSQQINIFIQFIRITKLTGQILDHLQANSCAGLQASSSHHAIIDIFESLLSDWLRELPPYLNYSPLTQHLSFPGQIANLHMQHQTLYMLLYYPYIAEYEKSRDRNIRISKNFVKSVNACSVAASKITNIGVEALNNITTCVTFPAMFYCLGKAAKVHSINILSPQRGLAINSYKNIIKTVKVCKFYKQHNIMKELVQKTISLLENILIKYQDKFSHEEIFGITPTGEIVNPDGLDLTLSSFGLSTNSIGNSSSNSSSIGPIMTSPPRIKVTPPNQIFTDSFEGTNNNAKSINSAQSILLSTSPNVDVSLQKRNDPTSNQIQQSNSNFNFIQNDNERNQQFPTGTLLDSLMLQTNSLTQNVVTASPTNEQHFWDIVSGGFNDNSSYDNITSTNSISTSSANQTPQTNYFSQPQRAQSLPTSTSSQEQYNSNHFRSQSFSSHSHSNQISFDTIDQDTHTSPNSSPTLQQSQRYVFMDINDDNENQKNSFTSENNNDFVTSEGNEPSSIYDDDHNSRMSFHNSNSASPNDTTYNIFFDNNLLTTSPTSSRSRMTSPCPSSSSELEIQNNAFANGLYFGASDELNNESAINLLSKRVGNCGVKSPSNVDTPVGIEYNQFDIVDGFRDFENGGI